MVDKDKVTTIVYSAIDEFNEELPSGAGLEPDPGTVLFGRNSSLDSLGLVNLIVAIERNLADELDAEITLADEKAMSQAASPFRTVGTLIDHIVARLEDQDDG